MAAGRLSPVRRNRAERPLHPARFSSQLILRLADIRWRRSGPASDAQRMRWITDATCNYGGYGHLWARLPKRYLLFSVTGGKTIRIFIIGCHGWRSRLKFVHRSLFTANRFAATTRERRGGAGLLVRLVDHLNQSTLNMTILANRLGIVVF